MKIKIIRRNGIKMIGIIFIADIKYCPYLNKYIETLNDKNLEYEVLFWNRDLKIREYPSNLIPYNLKSKLHKPSLLKLIDFFRFRKWINKQLKCKKYEKLIVLSTLSGMLMFDSLILRYRDKYIFDIRDYSYENNKLFYYIEKKVIQNSLFTCISSDGFREFLPKQQSYLTVHNFNKNELVYKKDFNKKDKGSKLNLVFIGGIRYFSHQVKIIDRLKNDNRFNIIYHGAGPELEEFINYCNEMKINNIKFTGEYESKDKYKLLENADILNNSYKTSKIMETKYAVSNKYYDGLIYGIPQLVETDSYKHEKIEAIGVGIGLDVEDRNLADKLYEYYFNIDDNKFNKKCENALSLIIQEDELYIEKIKNFIIS